MYLFTEKSTSDMADRKFYRGYHHHWLYVMAGQLWHLVPCTRLTLKHTKLYRARSQTAWTSSQSLYDRLIVHTVQTGLLTALATGVNLALWKWFPQGYYPESV